LEEITRAVRVIGGAEAERPGLRLPTVLELRDAACERGPDRALERVDLRVAEGDLHLLVGERGAGKSTVLELFAGLAWPSRGQLLVRNWPTWIDGPGDALELAIGHVGEEPASPDHLSVAETVVLGSEPGRCGHLARRRAAKLVAEHAGRLGVTIEPRARMGDLGLGERRLVGVLALAWRDVEVLLLDEPTTGLGSGETARMLAALEGLRAQGRCVVVASRAPGELLDLADGFTVLREGRSVATMAGGGSRRRVAELIGEVTWPRQPVRPPRPVGHIALQVKGLWIADGRAGPAAGLDLDVRGGEIHGLIDTTGNGALALAEAVAGLRQQDGGRVYLGTDDLTRLSVRRRRKLRLGYLPPPDGPGGLVGSLRLWENAALAPHRRVLPGPVGRNALAKLVAGHAASVGVDAHPGAYACQLTRGERQLLALARELGGPPGMLVAACPTRGLGRNDAERVWSRLCAARDAGAAILLATTDTEELLAVADRVTVMAGGRAAGELDGRWLTESELARAMALSPAGILPRRPWAQGADPPPESPWPRGPVPGWVR
jgi:general nucleoside transport system ATP-binding protein